jgi:hypothetical protein
MKKHIVLALMFFMNMQAMHPESLQEINALFKRVKRGTECLIKRQPCDPADTKAMYQAAGGIVAALALGAVGAGVIYGAKRYRSDEEKQLLKNQFASDVQSSARALQAYRFWRQQSSDFQRELAQHRDSSGRPLIIGTIDALKEYVDSEKAKSPAEQSWDNVWDSISLIDSMVNAGAKASLNENELKEVREGFESIKADLLTTPKITFSEAQQRDLANLQGKLNQ